MAARSAAARPSAPGNPSPGRRKRRDRPCGSSPRQSARFPSRRGCRRQNTRTHAGCTAAEAPVRAIDTPLRSVPGAPGPAPVSRQVGRVGNAIGAGSAGGSRSRCTTTSTSVPARLPNCLDRADSRGGAAASNWLGSSSKTRVKCEQGLVSELLGEAPRAASRCPSIVSACSSRTLIYAFRPGSRRLRRNLGRIQPPLVLGVEDQSALPAGRLVAPALGHGGPQRFAPIFDSLGRLAKERLFDELRRRKPRPRRGFLTRVRRRTTSPGPAQTTRQENTDRRNQFIAHLSSHAGTRMAYARLPVGIARRMFRFVGHRKLGRTDPGRPFDEGNGQVR